MPTDLTNETLESVMIKIGNSDLNRDERRDLYKSLWDEGVLQNLPSREFSEPEVRGVFQSLVDNKVIEPFDQNMLTLPAIAPGMKPAEGVTSAASAAGRPNAPTGRPGRESASPLAPTPPAGDPGLFSGFFNFGKEALQVAGDVSGVTNAIQMSKDPGTRKAITDFVMPEVGELGGALGGAALGGAIGNLPGAIIGGLLGSGLGAAGGLIAGRKMTGKQVTLQEAAIEGGVSLAPEILEAPIKLMMRKIAKHTPQAVSFVKNLIAKNALETLPELYRPLGADQIGNIYNMVRRSGEPLNITSLAADLESIEAPVFKRLITRLKASGLPGRDANFGEQMARRLEFIRSGQIRDFDIGELDDLDNLLTAVYRNMGQQAQNGALGSALSEVSGGIRFAKQQYTQNASTVNAKLLKRADELWARHKASLNMEVMLNKSGIIGMNEVGDTMTINLGNLTRELERGRVALKAGGKIPKSGGARVFEDLSQFPEVKAQLDNWLKEQVKFRSQFDIKLDEPTIGMWMSTKRMLSAIMLSFQGRRALERIILEEPGPLTFNQISLAFNATRRAIEAETEGKPVTEAMMGLGAKGALKGLQMIGP